MIPEIKKQDKKTPKNKYGVKIMVCEVHNDMPYEMLRAELRASKPFTKDLIEEFINKDETINRMKEVAETYKTKIKVIYTLIDDEILENGINHK